jgi:tRNA-2-methylthio-N6-dimethylallyladenosine synthase
MNETYHIETFGCQMNKNDSELMALSMQEHGFKPASDPLTADVSIYNTCSVREHAENRVISRIRSHRKYLSGKERIIVVAGCMAQRIGDSLVEDSLADMVIGPYQTPEIGRLLRLHLEDRRRRLFRSQDISDFAGRINPELYRISDTPAWHKWVTITHGCENFCSYCIVPSVRGKLISFPSGQILDYVRSLAAKEIREITLLGQNVNQYGTDSGDIPFHKLLESAAGTAGIERINFITSHPKDFSDDILHVIRGHANISRSIHLPLQSGSDRILGLMNRQYTLSGYLRIVDKINKLLAPFSLSTDLIVGFPGESESEFRETLSAVERIRFDDAFTYAYSPRRGTPAFSLEETLTRKEKIARLEELIALQRSISRQKLKELVNREEDTIIERFSKKSRDKVMGRTYQNHIVVTDGSKDDIGKKIRIKIESVRGATLQGTRIA